MKLLACLAVLVLAGCTTEDQTNINWQIKVISEQCHQVGGVMVTKHVWMDNGQNKFELVCTNIQVAQPPQGG